MLIASLSLIAFPFMTGFYSKDIILESTFGNFLFSSSVVYIIAIVGAMFTTLYSTKVIFLTFIANPNGPLKNYKNAHESDMFMTIPLILLAILSIFFGYFAKDAFIGLGSDFFSDNAIFIHPINEIMLSTEFAVPHLFKLLPLLITIILIVIYLLLSEFFTKAITLFKLSRLGYNMFGLLNQRFLIEFFYNEYIVKLILKLGGQTTNVLDKGSIELIGPFGLENTLNNISSNISKLNTSVVTSYALYILIGFIFYLVLPYIYVNNSKILILLLIGTFTI